MIELAEEGMDDDLCGPTKMGFLPVRSPNRVIFMDAGQIVEQNETGRVSLNNPQSERTQFVS